LFWHPEFFIRKLSGTPVNFGAPPLSRDGLGQGSRLGRDLYTLDRSDGRNIFDGI